MLVLITVSAYSSASKAHSPAERVERSNTGSATSEGTRTSSHLPKGRKGSDAYNSVVALSSTKTDTTEVRVTSADDTLKTPSTEALDKLVKQQRSLAADHRPGRYTVPHSVDLSIINRLFHSVTDTFDLRAAESEAIEARQNQLKGDYGLDLQAGYLQNFKAGFFGIAGLYYSRRAQLGLELDILKNGLLENRYEIEQLEREQSLLGGSSEQPPEAYFNALERKVQAIFSEKKKSLFRAYLDLLNRQEKIRMTLYHHNYRTWDEVLEVTAEKARIDRMLTNTKQVDMPDADQEIEADQLPVPEVQLEKLENAARASSGKGMPPAAEYVPEYNPLTDISLSASVRYNYYSSAPEEQLTGIEEQREFISVGLNLSVPLPMQRKEKAAVVEARRRQESAEARADQQQVIPELREQYGRYQELLADYEYHLQQYRMYSEQVRMESVKKRLEDPGYSGEELLGAIQQRYEMALELTDLQQRIYIALVNMYRYTYGVPMQQFARPMQFRDTRMNVSPQYAKSLYIWSDTFEKYENRALANYIEGQGFDTLFLSGGVEPDWMKIQSFVGHLQDSGVHVQWMEGDNSLMRGAGKKKLATVMKRVRISGADGLHLDVEPQTFDDWDQNQEQYKEQFVQLMSRVSEMAGERDLAFSFSIPVYFDSHISRLDSVAGNIQLMAYGSDQLETIERRTRHERNRAAGNVSIVLRPEDFSDHEQLNATLTEMKQQWQLEGVGIHALQHLIEIQNAALKSAEQ